MEVSLRRSLNIKTQMVLISDAADWFHPTPFSLFISLSLVVASSTSNTTMLAASSLITISLALLCESWFVEQLILHIGTDNKELYEGWINGLTDEWHLAGNPKVTTQSPPICALSLFTSLHMLTRLSSNCSKVSLNSWFFEENILFSPDLPTHCHPGTAQKDQICPSDLLPQATLIVGPKQWQLNWHSVKMAVNNMSTCTKLKQGSRSARLSPQSMIHYARKLLKCSIRIVQSFTILETTRWPDDQMTRWLYD